MERQSASAYLTWNITWTLYNARNPTFYWPVKCSLGMGHIRQKKHPFQIDFKIFSEGRCFHVLAWYSVYRVSLLCDKFWAGLDLKLSISGWKCKKVSTAPHLPCYNIHLFFWQRTTVEFCNVLATRLLFAITHKDTLTRRGKCENKESYEVNQNKIVQLQPKMH